MDYYEIWQQQRYGNVLPENKFALPDDDQTEPSLMEELMKTQSDELHFFEK